MSAADQVATLGLFEPRIEGDDSLMKLASRRFREAGMGAEMHAATPEHLEWVMSLRPWPEAPVTLHLPREFELSDESMQQRIGEFAARFAGRVSGMVLHDHRAMAGPGFGYMEAARAMNERLRRIDLSPTLFIEYAVGLESVDFARFFATIEDCERIGPCLDIGHVGIHAARTVYARAHGGEDVCALKSQPPHLRQLIPEVQAATAAGASAVFDLVAAIAGLKKPVHFHLHDGHPLSTFSPFGVSDHLSFLAQIPLNFEFAGSRTLAPMFGPAGLAKIVTYVFTLMQSRRVSFTLEIHPTGERLLLGDAAFLFNHWRDKTNAEKMNHWLAVLSANHALLLQAIQHIQE